ncbi:aspartyl/asparaginyl beta-hydroxylase domain-containing protein [Nocardia beijingensis]|uniref:aspartyl/asparaginyl beta-hydroxylase domain-containing protein n=1 Tax=Nocardia beijingensis TaxID=95162 RepID=UPI00189337CD|nr:aspartyl/asparaginyl beta-hydroxylase domain-containing protein [Nocardia beijingensis]MBF6465946.1 aspartyl/asparaginyl beta-hydroxylase domain-containing protein [Nocardia beijingensis]
MTEKGGVTLSMRWVRKSVMLVAQYNAHSSAGQSGSALAGRAIAVPHLSRGHPMTALPSAYPEASSQMPAAAELAYRMDGARLARELSSISVVSWQKQRTHVLGVDGESELGTTSPPTEIEWRVLPLWSIGGDADRTDPGGPEDKGYAPTIWWSRLPYMREVVSAIPVPFNSVRLMALGPGASSDEHCDPKYDVRRGFCRLHIPVLTNPDAILVLDGVRYCWAPGRLWYGDFGRLHRVENRGAEVRVHLVIDALMTSDLVQLFPARFRRTFEDHGALFNSFASAYADCTPWAHARKFAIPRSFLNFTDDAPLETSEPKLSVELNYSDHNVSMKTVNGTVLAMTPVGGSRFRFSGWSDQRTVVVDDGSIVLESRFGHDRRASRIFDQADSDH